MPAPMMRITFLPLLSSMFPNQGRTNTAESVKTPTIVPATVSLPPMVWAYRGSVDNSMYIDKNIKNETIKIKKKVLFHIPPSGIGLASVSYTHLRAHETRHDLVCR